MRAEELDLLRVFETHLASDPEHIMFSEGPADSEISIREADVLSGKVYRFLKDRGIGKEDMVNILLPRGIQPFVALLGVWKVGAAATILEEGYAKDRVTYIQKDSGCKLVLDSEAWKELQRCDPLEGYEPWDPHAAAFAVYTSGTTGNPKGVLHEYGKLPLTYASMSCNGEPFANRSDRFAYIAPTNFLAGYMAAILTMGSGQSCYIVPYSVVKNPEALMAYFLRHRISFTFMTASFFRLANDFGPYVKKVALSSEPANGLWKPSDKMKLWNLYASSEAGMCVSVALLDYPNTIAPVGKPRHDLKVVIRKANGGEAAPGEVGELCHEAPYVRGYINLPEETEKAFSNGLYHTGDLARLNEDGQLEIIGRCNDTIKLNGNRIEPAEVENAIQRVTGLRWVGVRAFEEGRRAYLCAYHTEDTPFDVNTLREKLMDMLPYYMLPSYFIKLDAVPRNANGKMDRMALPRALTEDYRAEYAAPENETQSRLCRAMEDVLRMDRIGIDDDFYLLGGDSLASMELLVASKLAALDISDIFKGRTARNIARILETRQPEVWTDKEQANRDALSRPHPLNDEQQYIYDYQTYYQKYTADSTMYNVFQLYRTEGVDPETLAKALSRTVSNHPALLTEIFLDENGEVMQRYRPDYAHDIEVEVLSREEWNVLRNELVQPFKLIESPLSRCRVFSVEGETYFFFDAHHIVFDGHSAFVFVKNLERILSGEHPLTDYCYYVLEQRSDEQAGPSYLEAQRYFRDRYVGTQWTYNLPPDYESPSNEVGFMEMRMAVPASKFAETEARIGLSKNGVVIAAGLLAMSKMTGAERVITEWVYNGRNTLESMQSVGLLYSTLPAALRLTENTTLGDICAQIREQIEKGIEYRACPYGYGDVCPNPLTDTMLDIIYQESATVFAGRRGLLRLDEERQLRLKEEETRRNAAACQTSVELEIWDEEDNTRVWIEYCASKYSPETVERFGKLFIGLVESITRQCGRPETTLRELFSEQENVDVI